MRTVKCFLLLLFCHSMTVMGQVISTLPSRSPNAESVFLYEVKLIDEFIERFNDDQSSYIRQQCRVILGSDSILNRNRLLQSLFDKKRTWGNDTAIFIKEVIGKAGPRYISFTDSNWYAEAICEFIYNGRKTDVPLILHIKGVNGGWEWSIAGLGICDLLRNIPGSLPDYKICKTPGDYIPTSSHGTNFVVFNSIFSDKMCEADYFDKELLQTPRGQYFTSLIKQHKISFHLVKKVIYHFFQVENWEFTVEQFKRKNANSGWLISELRKVSIAEKRVMLMKILGDTR